MLNILHRPETVAIQDECVVLHYSNERERQETFDFMEHYGVGEMSPLITSPSPSMDAIKAAAQVCNAYGFEIFTPEDGDMDDLDRERYGALCNAIAAAYAVDGARQ